MRIDVNPQAQAAVGRTRAAQSAVERARAAEAAGDLAQAIGHYEHAQRLAPGDAEITLSIGMTLIRQGDARASALLEQVGQRDDVREAWLALAALHCARRDTEAAASALSQVLSRAALPADPGSFELAGRVVRMGGLPGWANLAANGTLRTWLATKRAPAGLAVRLDGRALRLAAPRDGVAGQLSLALPAGWQQAQSLDITHDGVALLGSPIAPWRLARAEGFVETVQGGLRGWIWQPADPDAEPAVTIADGTARSLVRQARTPVSIAHPNQLARPRGFIVTAAELARFGGAVQVRGPDGRQLTGSPLDPGLEHRSAIAAAEAVRHLFPAGARSRGRPVAPAMPGVPAELVGPAARAPRRRRPVAVVVPAYRGLAETLACLDTVLADLPRDATVIVIDDASPEPELSAALRDLARAGRITLHRNATNLGFPAAANRGIQMAGARDVVLLNSDTLCPPGWLARLRAAAIAAADIGTVTPLSNDATVMSYPAVHADNPIPDLAETIRLDALAQEACGTALIDLPTAIGFCMYIRRECLVAVGRLRDDLFAQGYGEENDFCLRARHLGWRHVGLPSLFVGHVGGKSFGAAKQHLIARNLRILNRQHPGYDALIQGWLERDPMAEPRRRIDMLRWRAEAPPRAAGAVILISHDRVGGVARRVAERGAAIAAAGKRPMLLTPAHMPDGRRACQVSEGDTALWPNLLFALPAEAEKLIALLRADAPESVELHHFIGHDPSILDLPRRLGLPYDVALHDYSWFCPRINLVGAERRYCGEPDLPGCDICVRDTGTTTGEAITASALVARSAPLLARARRVVAPSNDAARRTRRHFPAVRPVVEPLEDDAELAPPRAARVLMPVAARDAGGKVRVAVLGAIGTEKGCDLLLACARDAAARRLALEFVVVGYTCDDARLLDTGRVLITGPYAREDGSALVRQMDADIGFLPSLWPETWCYVLSEAWQAGLSVLAFDLGAPSERIRATGRGWLLPLGAAPGIVNNALLAAGRQARAAG